MSHQDPVILPDQLHRRLHWDLELPGVLVVLQDRPDLLDLKDQQILDLLGCQSDPDHLRDLEVLEDPVTQLGLQVRDLRRSLRAQEVQRVQPNQQVLQVLRVQLLLMVLFLQLDLEDQAVLADQFVLLVRRYPGLPVDLMHP